MTVARRYIREPQTWEDAVSMEVRERIRDAVETLRRMRFPAGGAPAHLRAAWPDVVQDYWEVYGQHGPKIARILPGPAAIQRMDEVLSWFYWVTDLRQRKAMLLRAIPLSWRAVGRALGCSKDTAIRLEASAISIIVDRLTQDVDKCDGFRHNYG